MKLKNMALLGLGLATAVAPSAAMAYGSYVYTSCRFGTCTMYLCETRTAEGPGGPRTTTSTVLCTEIDSFPDPNV
ncbi:hypothetical protein [Erythrobacter oryzae]|uniref:hypothetical protein n=1 Tax=Erythrobacter oryzae TaxID=3019556 RepID=UPI0025564BB6|nr:hypothetical protein [Erythrobacter sp. COR-2]